jgi:hypothetical protein
MYHPISASFSAINAKAVSGAQKSSGGELLRRDPLGHG